MSRKDGKTHRGTQRIHRRNLLKRATAIGAIPASAAILGRPATAGQSTSAVTPTASPVGSPEAGIARSSITRTEVNEAIAAAFPFEPVGQTGGTLIYGESTDLQTLNPILSSDSYSGLVSRLIYSYLVESSPIDGTPIPDLADSWEIAPDGVTYTFHLNPGAMWHDGTPVTADDVVFSFDVTLDPEGLSPRQSTVSGALKDYRRVDDHTIALIATAPRATFVEETAGLVGIIPKHIWESVPPADFGSDPGSTGLDPSRVIGSGPFLFREWITNDHVTLEKNPHYWDTDQVPVIDEFIYRVIPDAASIVQALRTGEIDVSSVDYGQANALKAETDLRIVDFDTTGVNLFDAMQNEERSIFFLDPRVRQALMFALDRDLLAETVYLGYAIPADGTQPVLSIAHAPERIRTIYSYDPERARSLLEAAGWQDSDSDGIREKDSMKFSFECLYSEGTAAYEQQIPYMQQAWREIGIEMIPTAIPFPTLSDRGAASDYDMRLRGFTYSVSGGQGTMFRCDSVTPAGFNSMHYCNPRYDELDAQQAAELDPNARVNILIEQTNIVNDDVAIGCLLFRKSLVGHSPGVRNFFPNGYSTFWSLQKSWIVQA